MHELGTRGHRWQDIEFAHARNRPHAERPPIPQAGGQCFYRHDEWGPVELVTVVEVQDMRHPGCADDRNLFEPVRTPSGASVYGPDGAELWAPLPDPWLWLAMKRPDSRKPDGNLIGYGGIVYARESRLRGSAGWLPLDWESRPERWRLPGETARVVRPDPLTAMQRWQAWAKGVPR